MVPAAQKSYIERAKTPKKRLTRAQFEEAFKALEANTIAEIHRTNPFLKWRSDNPSMLDQKSFTDEQDYIECCCILDAFQDIAKNLAPGSNFDVYLQKGRKEYLGTVKDDKLPSMHDAQFKLRKLLEEFDHAVTYEIGRDFAGSGSALEVKLAQLTKAAADKAITAISAVLLPERTGFQK